MFNNFLPTRDTAYYSGWIICCVAITLFAQHAWVPGFFHDGHLYAALGKNIAEGGSWLITHVSQENYNEFNQHPPLFFILEGLFFKMVGVSWTTARLFTLSWVFLALFVLYRLCLNFSNRRLAFLGTLLLAILPPLFKKARSPNIDVALMCTILCSLSTYFLAFYHEKKKRAIFYWNLSGLLFGAALLIKGPPALLIPMTIGLHLLLTGKLKFFLSPWPWFSLLLGLAFFSLWPLSLHKIGRFDFFMDYWKGQVIATILKGRGRTEIMLGTYPYYLLENASFWFLLSLWGIGKMIKERCRDPLLLLFLALYLAVLIPFSFVNWKYSNYIVPCFPAMAILAAYPLTSLPELFHRWCGLLFKKGILIVALVLLVFPMTIKSRRDRELIDLTEALKSYDIKPTHWYLVGDSYSFFQVVDLMAWLNYGEVKEVSMDMVISLIKLKDQKSDDKRIFLMKQGDVNSIQQNYPDLFVNNFSKIMIFSQTDTVALLYPHQELVIKKLSDHSVHL